MTLRSRYLLMFVTLAVVPCVVAVMLLVGHASDRIGVRAASEAEARLALRIRAITDNVRAGVRDLRMLSGLASGPAAGPEEGTAGDPMPFERMQGRLAEVFHAYLASHPAARRAVLLTQDGLEVLRVEAATAGPVRAVPQGLPGLLTRGELEEAIALPAGQVRVWDPEAAQPVARDTGAGSPGSLPFLRMASPVRINGLTQGLIVVDSRADFLIDPSDQLATFVLAAADGRQLFPVGPTGEASAPTLQREWPEFDPVRAHLGQVVERGGRTLVLKAFNVNPGTPARIWVAGTVLDAREVLVTADGLRGWLLALGGGVVAISALLALFAARRVARPLVDLIGTMRSLSAGDTSVRLSPRHRGQLGDVARALNAMLDTLERNRAELIAARDAAESITRTKSEFLANMSHEIRTPMNGVLGMLELLEQSDLSATDRGFVQTARTSAESLLGLLNDILDFSKIEAGKLRLETIDFDARELAEDVGALLGKQAHRKGIELVCVVPQDLPPVVRGDPSRLRQVLVNLVGNAVKFTEQGEVVLSVKLEVANLDVASITFEVRDTGVGMATDTMLRLFRPFTQADSSTTRKYGGTGLGLAISRQLVAFMGGDLKVVSEVGHGSTFWFTLDVPIGDGTRSGLVSDGALSGLRALVVDDNATNRLIVEHHLAAWGMNFAAAEDGTSAWNLLERDVKRGRRFDVILLDHHMPGMDGPALSRRIAQDARLGGTPRILLSSSGALSPQESEAAGLAASLAKPLRARQLHEAIAIALGRQAAAPASPRLAPRRRRMPLRLLLVEDNPVNQKIVVITLKRLGYEVDVASNGREALSSLAVQSYNLILMDCQMPEMDGFELTAMLREREAATGQARVPIIALTANALDGDRQRCIDAGMDDYLTKPFKQEQLAEMLEHWLPEQGAGKAA